jgi:hypothetical protein
MPGQMQRIVHKQVGEELLEALHTSELTLQAMLEIYGLVNANFTRSENDIDPVTIQMGIQGQALAVIVLTQWLDALGTVLGEGYKHRASEARKDVATALDDLGIVLPLPNPL